MRTASPPPKLTVSEWADQCRKLSSESSAEPGTWNTARAEYQRGIMDAISEPGNERVVLMTSAQVGKTEIINSHCAGCGPDPGAATNARHGADVEQGPPRPDAAGHPRAQGQGGRPASQGQRQHGFA